MKKIYSILLSALALVVTNSCEQLPELPSQTLTVSMETIVATPMGAEYALLVDSNTKWSLDNDSEDWVKVDITENTGMANLVISVLPNEKNEERKAKLVVSTADKQIRRQLVIAQAGSLAKGFISISLLRNLDTGEERLINGNRAKIKGFVTTDVESGNWDAGSFVIQDRYEDLGSALVINCESVNFERGAEVAVCLDGARLRRDGRGMLVLEPKEIPELTATTKVIPDPIEISYEQLLDGGYEAMYVSIPDVQVADEDLGRVWSVSPSFVFRKGHDRIRTVISDNATFAAGECSELSGSLLGLAGPSGRAEVYPVSVEDLALDQRRFYQNAGLRGLPYVFSFYCSENTNATPKYVEYNNALQWDEKSLMLEGTLATDMDLSIGAYLDIAAFATSASKMQSSGKANFWAEKGAHDNVNASGFLTYPEHYGDTKAVKECGFYLTIPMQMDMPKNFNVSFGMAGNEYTKSDWAVEYSNNRIDWYHAGQVRIDEQCREGSYYLYFTVPVELEIPVTAGEDSYLYIKFIPKGGRPIGKPDKSGDAYGDKDGHGSSTWLRLHSAIVLSQEQEGNTVKPAGAVYFESFDKLTSGMDYFLGDRLAALANFCADGFEDWTQEQKNGLSGENVYERPGYAQIGFVDTERAAKRTKYENKLGRLTTPPLAKGGDLTLSFKAAAYKSPAIRPGQPSKDSDKAPDVRYPDLTSIIIEVLNGGSINGTNRIAVRDIPTDKFESYSFAVKGAVEGQTQICFTSAAESSGEDDSVSQFFSRWFIDDISVIQ